MAALQVNASLGSINPKTNLPNGVTTDREVSAGTLAAAAAVDAATLAAAVVVFEGNKDDLVTETAALTTHSGDLTTHVATFNTSKGGLNTHNTAAVTHTGTVAAALAVLQADGALPTEAHVDDLQVQWDLLAADLASINTDNTAILADYTAIAADKDLLVTDDAALAATNTLVGTDYTDIAAASVALTADTAAASGSSAGDVNVSWDTTTVTTISQLKTALDQILKSAASSLAP
jgi:hypothetical protein